MAKATKRRQTKTALVRGYLTEHPKATTVAVCKALKRYGVTPNDVSNARYRADQGRQRGSTAGATTPDVPVAVELRVPAGGVVLKLRNGHGMIGTFTFTEAGVRYVRANAKKQKAGVMPYATMERLMEIGMVAYGDNGTPG
jgi:hypothetical protein